MDVRKKPVPELHVHCIFVKSEFLLLAIKEKTSEM